MSRRLIRRVMAFVVAGTCAGALLSMADGAAAVDVTSPPRISVGGGSVVEGQLTRRYVKFPVALSWPAPSTITVHYATGDPSDTATAPADYKTKTGTLTFKAKQRFKMLAVLVWPDTIEEGDHTLSLKLSSPSGASLAPGMDVGTATIIDDDPSVGKRVSIGDSVAPEPCAGLPTNASVVVTLSAPLNESETVHVQTGPADVPSAVAGVDYTAVNKNVTFTASQILKDIRIPIRADTALEGPEQFKVTLSLVSGSVPVGRSEAVVTIPDCQPA